MKDSKEYIKSYLEYLEYEKKLSKNTIQAYNNDLTKLANFKSDLLNINSNDIKEFIKKNRVLTNRTLAHRLTVINSFYNYLLNEGIITTNPCYNIKMPKLPNKLPEVLTEEEVDKLLDINLTDKFAYRNKAMLELLYATGMRASELTNLKLNNIDLDSCVVRIMGKGSKERIVPINSTTIKYLNIYLNVYRKEILNKKDSEYLFISNALKPITRQGLFKIIKKECLRAGIKKNVYPHILRHSFATHLLNHGANIRIIQELLGHEDISTTEIYTHLSNEAIKKDYEEYFPRS